MFALRLISAAGCLSTLISGAPVPSFLSSVAKHASFPLVQRAAANTYKVYSGTGAVTEGWPSQSAWISTFDDMFEAQQSVMTSSCAQWSVPENTDSEIALMKSAIETVASSSGVDSRFILAIVMQESNGCIRAPTTNYGVRNPGLMQSHNGAGTCNDGTVQTPCPEAEILQMITDGTSGTNSGDGLAQLLAQAGVSDVSKYYKAARMYNSGSIDSSGNLGAGIATHCYATDIANRLTGWYSGTSACDSTTIASLIGTLTSVDSAASAIESIVVSKPTTAAGGVFVELPSTTREASTTTVAIEEPARTSESAVLTAEPITATVIPIPVASSTSSPSPQVVAPAPSSTSSLTTPTSTPSSSIGSEIPGSACSTEGLWNCVTSSTFQQCASGTWSVVQSLAAGMECAVGQSMTFSVSAISS